MQKKTTKIIKVPQGKLLRIDIVSNREIILDVSITGDFFMHPEDAISLFEKKIKDIPIKFDREKLQKTLDKIVKDNNIEISGIRTNDIVQTLDEML